MSDVQSSLKGLWNVSPKGRQTKDVSSQTKAICQQKNFTKRNTKENTSGRSKIVSDRSTDKKEEMKITEQDKYVAKAEWTLIVNN